MIAGKSGRWETVTKNGRTISYYVVPGRSRDVRVLAIDHYEDGYVLRGFRYQAFTRFNNKEDLSKKLSELGVAVPFPYSDQVRQAAS